MGKPYKSELEALSETYDWAKRLELKPLIGAVKSALSFPFMVTGSGGSLTAATLAAALHQRHTCILAKSVTPLDLISSLPSNADCGVMILSAGGRNPDVLAALRTAITQESRRVVVVCSRRFSPLAAIAAKYPHIDVFDFDLPCGRDGFLATNSLLAFCVILARAYAEASGSSLRLPSTLNELVFKGKTQTEYLQELEGRLHGLWERAHLVVLFGDSTRAAAQDFESKFTEAALGVTLPADFRNFAHGRHHWLAKHEATSAVIALVGDEESVLASKTLALLPKTIPVIQLRFPGDWVQSALKSILAVMHLTLLAGRARNIDPGRPGVPTFGRNIYHLRLPPKQRARSRIETILFRKTRADAKKLLVKEKRHWRNAFTQFANCLKTARYGAVALDYDGTLCDLKNRFRGVDAEIATELVKLLKRKMLIGIATGRGDSVRQDLRRVIPANLYNKVIIGYYNGAEIAPLSDDSKPDPTGIGCPELASIQKEIKANFTFTRLASWKFRKFQITAEPHPDTKIHLLWDALQQLLHEKSQNLTLVRSGHSIDILAKGISKSRLVEAVRSQIPNGIEVLCIGDNGRWPGNDFALLSEPTALSVDEGSLASETCWNLAPEGFRGTKATLFYLRSLKGRAGKLQLNLPLGDA